MSAAEKENVGKLLDLIGWCESDRRRGIRE